MDRTTFPTRRSWRLYWQTVPPTRRVEFIPRWEWFLLTSLDYLPLSRHRQGRNGLSIEDDDKDNDDDDDDDDDDNDEDDNEDDDNDDDEEEEDDNKIDHHDNTDDNYAVDKDEDDDDDNDDDSLDHHDNEEDDNNGEENDGDDNDDDDDDDGFLYSVSTVDLEVFCRYIQRNGHILLTSHENDSNTNKEDDV